MLAMEWPLMATPAGFLVMVGSQHELVDGLSFICEGLGLIPRKPDRHSPVPVRTFADVPKLRTSHPFGLAAATTVRRI
jgi:hypothetical protein